MALYSTDASVFEIQPLRVVKPKSREALAAAVRDVIDQRLSLTMRAGGTSLGGQAIGSGIVMDVSQYLTEILDYQPKKKRVRLEPGVIQDDLNRWVAKDGLVFAPDTSTSNRAMLGGMLGNNSCGSYSVFYGTTREHTYEVEAILSDGSEVVFRSLSAKELAKKSQLDSLEGDIYRGVLDLLERYQQTILAGMPDESVVRRNTGYALDVLLRDYKPFNPSGKPFSLVPLICGSEGTLCAISAATVGLVEKPRFRQLVCGHFSSVAEALAGIEEQLKFKPAAIELMDRATLDATAGNALQEKNRFWIKDSPEAVLITEFFANSAKDLAKKVKGYQDWLLANKSYAAVAISPDDSAKVWDLRKAGLGLLMGKRTRKKAVAVIEDAAVPVASLPSFYRDVTKLVAQVSQKAGRELGAVYYGHASVGLLHIRPELDLAVAEDRQKFADLADGFSKLVKKYRGALSGEHGDGRIRAPFLREQVGDEVYQAFVELKRLFDPENIFNPGVILGDASIVENHRADRQAKNLLETGFDWRADISLIDAVEKCNGAGACRKSSGLMCPSYQATREEALSTRGRANLLRRALTEANPKVALSRGELQEALQGCLACKACKTECPASVDMARLKAEVSYQLGAPRLVAWSLKNQHKLMSWALKRPRLFGFVQNLSWVKRALGVDKRRSLPAAGSFSLEEWFDSLTDAELDPTGVGVGRQRVWVLCDLYSQFQEPEVGKGVIESLLKLGLEVKPIFMQASPRALIGQGLLKEAAFELQQTIRFFRQLEVEDYLIGIEPSEVLTWRDEARDLLPKRADSFDYSQVRLYEELLLDLVKQDRFPSLVLNKKVWLQVHCHQKSLAGKQTVVDLLNQIKGVEVTELSSGCCGMSGDFGYKNYDLSRKIAERELIPNLNRAARDDVFVATGTSCRCQIADFSEQRSLHTAELFNELL